MTTVDVAKHRTIRPKVRHITTACLCCYGINIFWSISKLARSIFVNHVTKMTADMSKEIPKLVQNHYINYVPLSISVGRPRIGTVRVLAEWVYIEARPIVRLVRSMGQLTSGLNDRVSYAEHIPL